MYDMVEDAVNDVDAAFELSKSKKMLVKLWMPLVSSQWMKQ